MAPPLFHTSARPTHSRSTQIAPFTPPLRPKYPPPSWIYGCVFLRTEPPFMLVHWDVCAALPVHNRWTRSRLSGCLCDALMKTRTDVNICGKLAGKGEEMRRKVNCRSRGIAPRLSCSCSPVSFSCTGRCNSIQTTSTATRTSRN